MPLLKTSNTDLVRIDLTTPGEWVDVKRALGKDDERRRAAILLRGQAARPGERIPALDLGILLERAAIATMMVVVKAWNLIDPDTLEVAAISEENLAALSDEDMALLKETFDELYPAQRSDDDRKNSSGGGAPPSAARENSRPSSGG